MKRIKPLALLALFTIDLHAGQPTLESLGGPWWDEGGRSMLDIGDGGKGDLFDCGTQTSQPGEYSMSPDGKLSFTASGKPAKEWAASMDGDYLVLKPADSAALRFRRETRESREKRCEEVLREARQVKHSLETAGMEVHAADRAQKRAKELQAQFISIIESLAGSSDDAQVKLHESMLARVAPESVPSVPSPKLTECAKRLKDIGLHLIAFEDEKKFWPRDLAVLVDRDFVNDESFFKCPAMEQKDPYVYVPPADGKQAATDSVLLYDSKSHSNGLRNVLCIDGSVTLMNEQELQKALKEGSNTVRPRVTIDLVKFSNTADGLEMTVSGTVSGLRVAERVGKPHVRGSLSVNVHGVVQKAYRSDGVRVAGASGEELLKFTAQLNLGSEPQDSIKAYLQLQDEMRGDFLYVPIDSKAK